MKKCIALFAFILFIGFATSCSDTFDEEFQELQTDPVNDTGGSLGGDDQKSGPE